MRVLFLYPRALDPKKSVGGVAEFLYHLTPALHALKIKPVVYAGNKEGVELKGPIYLHDTIPIYSGPFIKPSLWVSRKRLAPALQVCRDLDIDAIHAQGTYTAGFMAMQIAKRLSIPYVVTSHSDILTTNSKRLQRKNVQRRCRRVLANASQVTHLTPMMEQASHLISDTRHKSSLIGNGIDSYIWQPFVNLPEKNYMLGIGRLEPGKGFHILIDMYADLVKCGFTTSLIIAGKGSAEAQLHEQAKATGMNVYTGFSNFDCIPEKSILFTGYVRGVEKQKLIAQSRVVLFATQPQLWEEAFGIVQLEAMAAGRAIVASNTHVSCYLQTQGMQALLVEQPDDISQWVMQTKKLLQDDAFRRQLGKKNLSTAAHFDWQPIAKKYRDVYLMMSKSKNS